MAYPTNSISPLSIKTQLNWNPRVCIHFMCWFDGKKHLNVGYLSNDPDVVKSQIEYLHQRGVDFLVIDYYGPQNTFQESVVNLVKAECERRGDMKFALCFDHGALNFKPSTTSDTDWMLSVIKDAAVNHMASASYEKLPDGRFLAHEFGWETVSDLDITKITGSFNLIAFFFRNTGGWTKPGSAGAYGWEDYHDVPAYTKNFISVAQSHPTGIWFGSISKGFDDHNRTPGADQTKSVWNSTVPARIYPENHGQTWLNNIAAYNAATIKPQYLQIVTFNDHEEGTSVEFGIDSDVVVTGSHTDGKVTLSYTGNVNVIDHVQFYLDDVFVVNGYYNTNVFSLPTDSIETGNHTFSVKIIAKPFFKNMNSFLFTIPVTATVMPDQTVTIPLDTTVTVDVDTSVSVPVSGTLQGLTLSGTVTVPIHQSVSVPVKQPVQVAITKKVVWS